MKIQEERFVLRSIDLNLRNKNIIIYYNLIDMIQRKDKIELNIKKAIGTLTKVQKMIEDDVYCADIAHQINASMGLLQSANRELLKNHLACCGTKALS